MTKGDDGWWTIEIPVGYTNLLINANGGSNQTPDINGLSGQDVWINALTDSQNPVFKYEPFAEGEIEEPATTEPADVTIRPTEGLKNDAAAQNESKGGKDLTVLLAVVGSVVIIAVAAVIIIVAKSKKKA